jgi:hypothetical protein
MEGTRRGKKRVLVVQRDYEKSRLEQAQLAAAYERVLPEAEVVLSESRSKAKSSATTSVVSASNLFWMEPNLCAIGGRV